MRNNRVTLISMIITIFLMLLFVFIMGARLGEGSENLDLTARDNMVYTIDTYKVKRINKVNKDGSSVSVYYVFRPLRAGWVLNGVEKFDSNGRKYSDTFRLNDYVERLR